MDQSTASFTEPMRPSISHSNALTTIQRQSTGTGLGRSRETGEEEGEEENLSDDEVSNKEMSSSAKIAPVDRAWACHVTCKVHQEAACIDVL